MDGWVKIGTELDTKSFDAQIKEVETQLEEIEHKLEKSDMGFEVGDTVKLEAQYEKLSQKLSVLLGKQATLNRQDFNKVSQSIETVGTKMEGVIKKVGKWALAVFGIRSAYLGIRRAISVVSSYNDQIKTDIEYISYALASTLEPIIQWLIKGVFTLLQYVNYLAMAWFGVNIFAKATTDNFKKTNAQAKELKKTLTGFDEMNVLNEDGSTGVLGGNTLPSVDLSQMNLESEKLTNFWAKIFSFWDKEWEKWFLNVGGNWGSFVAGIGITVKGFFDFFKGIFEMMSGIIDIFVGIFTGDIEKMREGWEKLLKGFVDILTGILEIILGIFIIIGGALKGLVLDFWGAIVKIFGGIGKWFGDRFTEAYEGIKKAFSSIGTFFQGVWNTIKDIFKGIGQTVGNIVGTAFKTAINAVLALTDLILNSPIRAINKLIGVINEVPGINLGKLNEIKLPRLATGGIINYPNRGVPVGGGRAIGGEAGAEGVIPLTDSQAMATLGEAIGRYITINATIENKMDSRVINRTLQSVKTSNDFIMNR